MIKFLGTIYVIFDSKDKYSHMRKSEHMGITSIFTSSKKDADQEIIDMLRTSTHTHDTIVISEDNRIMNHCKVYGARNESVSFLIDHIRNKRSNRPCNQKDSSGKQITKRQADEINKFLKQTWGIK